ncbi:MAG: shikimate dehydrogenase [Pseudomonadota bacterium]
MIIKGSTSVTGVIGGNIAGSLSPVIHNYWYDKYDINGVYVAFTAQKENFAHIAEALFASGIKGLNITVPLKEAAFDFANDLTETAQKAGAVNTLYPSKGKIIGHNTDGYGFCSAVRYLSSFDFKSAKILIIGAGGAAAGVIEGLMSEGAQSFDILNRTYGTALALAEQFSQENMSIEALETKKDLRAGYDLIVNTTTLKEIIPKGINDIPEEVLRSTSLAIDINYGFSPNAFLARAKSCGAKVCDGLEMLLQQARPGFALFNDTDMPDADDDLRQMLLKC